MSKLIEWVLGIAETRHRAGASGDRDPLRFAAAG